MTIFRCIFYRW